MYNNPECMKLLLEAGADINSRDNVSIIYKTLLLFILLLVLLYYYYYHCYYIMITITITIIIIIRSF